MEIKDKELIEATLDELYADSKNDKFKMIKGFAKAVLRPMQPIDFKEVYLSISKEQGEELVELITNNNLKNIVEFGTSFDISTLFLAQGVLETKGHIITTELIASKAQKAIQNFESADVGHLIDVRIGNAIDTLKNLKGSIDLLLLDGWKDLYLPLFELLESNFHKNTIIYVDNANMKDSQLFLQAVSKNPNYELQSKFDGKVVLISKVK